jgi:hypothetical protein
VIKNKDVWFTSRKIVRFILSFTSMAFSSSSIVSRLSNEPEILIGGGVSDAAAVKRLRLKIHQNPILNHSLGVMAQVFYLVLGEPHDDVVSEE